MNKDEQKKQLENYAIPLADKLKKSCTIDIEENVVLATYNPQVYLDMLKKYPPTKMYEVWVGGYAVTGESSGATYHGCMLTTSWEKAVEAILSDSLDKDKNGDIKKPYTVWACGVYDNEVDARKSFG